jgi:hypothetical protein
MLKEQQVEYLHNCDLEKQERVNDIKELNIFINEKEYMIE